MPEGSCRSAMRRPSRASSARRRAGPGGGGCGVQRAVRLRGVDDEALAQHRVQDAVRGACRSRRLDDVPLEQLAIAATTVVVVVGRPDRAPQPPVGRVQRVGVVRRARARPASRMRTRSSSLAVDAHVAALDERRVVLLAEHPAHLLGEPRGHGDGHRAARPQHPGELAHRAGVVGMCSSTSEAMMRSNARVGEGQGRWRRPGPCRRTAVGDLARLGHGAEGRPHFLQLGVA